MRAAELEDERELFAEITLRHERARIAGELHDIIGHAISVMVIQAATGQRLVDTDPGRAREAFAAISESARQGSRDLERLIELLGGTTSVVVAGPDLSLVDEMVPWAGRSGLNVTCRFEGDRDRVPEPVAHLAFRVVQESLTNALRYAPGARSWPVADAASSACASASRTSPGSSAPAVPAWAGGQSRRAFRRVSSSDYR